MSPLLRLPLQPPSTGNSHLPSTRSAGAPSHYWNPWNQEILQCYRWHVYMTDFLPFITAYPRPPHFQNILVSISYILCQTELYLTLQEEMFRSHSNLLQMSEKNTEAHLGKGKTYQECKEKKDRCVGRPNARSILWPPGVCRLNVIGIVAWNCCYGTRGCCCA